MTKRLFLTLLGSIALYASLSAQAQDVIELDTTTITGNTELPKFLYVVPWQDKTRKSGGEQKLVLHNLYGDLFDPVMPARIAADEYQLKLPKEDLKK